MSCHVMRWWDGMSWHVGLCHVMSCHVMSFPYPTHTEPLVVLYPLLLRVDRAMLLWLWVCLAHITAAASCTCHHAHPAHVACVVSYYTSQDVAVRLNPYLQLSTMVYLMTILILPLAFAAIIAVIVTGTRSE